MKPAFISILCQNQWVTRYIIIGLWENSFVIKNTINIFFPDIVDHNGSAKCIKIMNCMIFWTPNNIYFLKLVREKRFGGLAAKFIGKINFGTP